MPDNYALTDEQWHKLAPLLPGRKGHIGATAKDNRLFINAVLYRYRSGSSWRGLPKHFGDFRIIHTRFSRWHKKGIWHRVIEVLIADKQNEYASVDRTILNFLPKNIS
jgi:transposase